MVLRTKYDAKKYATATAAVVVAATIVAMPTDAATKFPDLNEGQYFYNDVLALQERGIINGYSDGTFKPNNTLTRGQAAKMIAGFLELDTENVPDPNFTDISSSNQYYGAIAALKAAGIIDGYEDQTFRHNEPIKRNHMAKIIVNATGLQAKNPELLPFTDISDSYKSYIAALYENKVTTGKTPTTFEGSKNVTRGQMAAFIIRAEKALKSNPPKDFTLSIMHNNDIHSNLNNIPKTITAIKEYRNTKPNALLLNAGDVFSGTLYFNTFEGEADLALMKLMGYDAMTLGNHEFDLGSSEQGHQALVDFIQGANFPIVSSNIDFSKDEKFTGLFSDLISSKPEEGKIYNGIVKEIDGEKVGIFGLTTAETKDISSPGSLEFEDYLEEAEKAVKAFEGMGVNKIVALTHIGYDDNPAVDNDLSLAKLVDGIDVIVGGHSHTELKSPVIVDQDENGETKDKTVIVQAYQYNSYLGTLDVKFDAQGKVVTADGELVSIGAQAEDEEAVAVLKPFKDKVNEVSAEEIGVTLKEALTTPRSSDAGNTTGVSVRNSETILGNIITDGMLAKSKKSTNKEVIMAVQNGGGIRAAINEGPVTIGEVITVLPFGNTLAIMDITGEEVKEMFEHSVSQAPRESGGFLHVSGAKVRYDSTKPAGERVVSIEYKNADGQYVSIDPTKTYTIATNAFTAKGGDGFTMLQKAYEDGRVTDLGLSDWENLKEQFLAIKDNIPTSTEGRIFDIARDTLTLTPADLAGGTKENPIVIKENAIIDITSITKIEHVVFEGNVTLIGTAQENFLMTNIKVNGKVNVSDVIGNVDLDGVEAQELEL